MTFDELEKSDKDFLTPEDVSGVLGCHPYSINVQAREDITKLGFPAAKIGTRVRIPRLGFIRWMTYGNAPVSTEEMRTAT